MEEKSKEKKTSIVPVETTLAERQVELVAVKTELVEVKQRKRQVSKKVTQAKILATPPWLRSIDEIKRRSGLPRHLKNPNINIPYQDAFLRWLNELEIESAELKSRESELFERLDELQGRVEVLNRVSEGLTPRHAYKLLRREAKKHGMKSPRKTSVDGAKMIYRNMAKMYHPDSYRAYAHITHLTSKEEAEEKFKEIIIIIGICYKKVCESSS